MLNAKFDNALGNRIKGIASLHTCNPKLIESSMDGIGTKIPLAVRLIRATGFGATNPIDHNGRTYSRYQSNKTARPIESVNSTSRKGRDKRKRKR